MTAHRRQRGWRVSLAVTSAMALVAASCGGAERDPVLDVLAERGFAEDTLDCMASSDGALGTAMQACASDEDLRNYARILGGDVDAELLSDSRSAVLLDDASIGAVAECIAEEIADADLSLIRPVLADAPDLFTINSNISTAVADQCWSDAVSAAAYAVDVEVVLTSVRAATADGPIVERPVEDLGGGVSLVGVEAPGLLVALAVSPNGQGVLWAYLDVAENTDGSDVVAAVAEGLGASSGSGMSRLLLDSPPGAGEWAWFVGCSVPTERGLDIFFIVTDLAAADPGSPC